MEELGQVKRFTVIDPRTFDGNVYETAERAIRQSAAVAEVLSNTLPIARILLRNAELDRQLLLTGECDSSAFDDSPQGRKISQVQEAAETISAALKALTKAAAYNPKR